MSLRTLTLVLALSGLTSGCTLTQLTPTARLSESVNQLNDMSRWGQIDMAVQTVSPKYKTEFRTRRREWGEGISIAEVELIYQQLAPDKESGVSEIALSWTEANGVMLRRSVITQRWASERGSFHLVGEVIKKGDPALFAASTPKSESAR
ncbi:MAG: hypothetical protein JWN48_5295 [Myxococcaceae bacterium]|nr:hypothetical protein [Myxococcaceae bacterium]